MQFQYYIRQLVGKNGTHCNVSLLYETMYESDLLTHDIKVAVL